MKTVMKLFGQAVRCVGRAPRTRRLPGPSNLGVTTMIPRMFLLCVAAIAMTSNAFGQSVPWVQPIGGTNNVDWTIVNYVDTNTTAGTQSDYTGATGNASFTYDGHQGIDLTLPNFAAMDRGVSVFA